MDMEGAVLYGRFIGRVVVGMEPREWGVGYWMEGHSLNIPVSRVWMAHCDICHGSHEDGGGVAGMRAYYSLVLATIPWALLRHLLPL